MAIKICVPWAWKRRVNRSPPKFAEQESGVRVQRSYEPEDGALRGERLHGRAAATGKGFDTSVVVNEETNRQLSPTVRTFVISGSPGATE